MEGNVRRIFILMIISLLIISGCSGDLTVDNSIDFGVQFLETNYHKETNTIFKVVSSRDEIEQYYDDACPNWYYPEENVDYYANKFWEAIEVYTDTFFSDKYLVIILINEGSGSIGHEVERIDENGNIIINRLLPNGDGTDDMAEWHIIIELENDFNPEQFNVVLQDKVN